MQGWLTEVVDLLQLMFGKAGGPVFFAAVAAAVLVYVFVLHLIAGTFDFGRTHRAPLLGASVLGMAILLAAAVAARRFVHLPGVPASWVLPGTLLLAWLALVIPLHCLLLKSNFMRVAIAMLISIAAAVLVVFFIRTVATTIASGKREVNPARAHKRAVEEAVSK